MPQAGDKINNYSATASGPPGMKESLGKWACSQPEGNKINNYFPRDRVKKGPRE